jgi:type II secretory pathway pseudopilin PulG
MRKRSRVEGGALRVKRTVFARRVRGPRSLNPQPSTLDPSARGGFTLLEVLVSIFVLLFGLLAVAAVVPIAGLRIIQTKQADHSAACGQSAMRDVKVRRMTEPRKWLRYVPSDPNKTPNGFVPVEYSHAGQLAIPFQESFAIDPLGFAKITPISSALARFPYDSNSIGTLSMMRRVTLDTNPATNVQVPNPSTYIDMDLALADRIFTWHDDLTIPVPSDSGTRPTAVIGNGVVQIDGKYSWVATVTPIVDDNDAITPPLPPVAMHYIDRHRTYLVSVVVFYNRDFSAPNAPIDPETPGERVVRGEVVGEGYGGGDLRLFLPSGSTASPAYLNVRNGDWLMLCGTNTGTSPSRGVFQWYRVVVSGEDAVLPDSSVTSSNATWERYVTMSGPDWNTAWCTGVDSDLNLDTLEVDVALFTRVIGVYTTTIELDEPGSLWGN